MLEALSVPLKQMGKNKEIKQPLQLTLLKVVAFQFLAK